MVLVPVAEGVTPFRATEEAEREPERELVHLAEPDEMGEFKG